MFSEKIKCPRCKSKVKEKYDFCPHCGLDLSNPEKDARDFGLLGKNEFSAGAPLAGGLGGLGITDKMINSIMNSLMNNLAKNMKDIDPEIQNLPNGIKINFGIPQNSKPKRIVKKGITQEQVKKMSGLPRVEGKTQVRRLSDKVVYEIKAQGIESVEDIFVSRLENGYEVKAIGKKKVYVNSLPINLPLKGYSIHKEGLTVEFGLE